MSNVVLTRKTAGTLALAVAAMFVASTVSAKEVRTKDADGVTRITQDPAPSDDNSGEIGEIRGDVEFRLRHVGSDKRFVDVSTHGHKLFSVAEQKIDLSDNQGMGYSDLDFHDFYLSPDHKYMFVEQKVVHCVDGASLYGPGPDGEIGAIRPHGLPFDSAAIAAFKARMKLTSKDFGQYTRVTHFEKWTGHGVDFSMGLANFWCGSSPDKGDAEYDWTGHYDFKTHQFSHIVVTSKNAG